MARRLYPSEDMMTGTLLLAEDNSISRKIYRESLEREGYRVIDVGDGKAALDAAGRHCPDVAVMDLGLPDDDAFVVLQQLKALGVFLIAYSGWHNAEMAAREAGADAFVLKPDIDVLEQLLKNVALIEAAPGRKKDRAIPDR